MALQGGGGHPAVRAPAPRADEPPQAQAPLEPGRIGPPPVRHISQTRPAGATSEYLDEGYCGPTCLAMVARAYGLGSQFTDAELVMRLCRIAGATARRGTDRTGLYRMATHLRLSSQDWDGEATFWMARHLEQGHYVVAAGNPYVLPPYEKLEGYGGHFIVVDGMDETGNFLMKNPWPDGVHAVPPLKMWQFLMTHGRPYQYAFWR
ncbi:MAG: C39 family peptidase [Myxococcales bacterium]|nr:C39 family peptidase [Myxococcales bacterium]